MALSEKDHSILNDPIFLVKTDPQYLLALWNLVVLETLRERYADDPVALEQIDLYDSNSPHERLKAKMRRAFLDRDFDLAELISQQIAGMYGRLDPNGSPKTE